MTPNQRIEDFFARKKFPVRANAIFQAVREVADVDAFEATLQFAINYKGDGKYKDQAAAIKTWLLRPNGKMPLPTEDMVSLVRGRPQRYRQLYEFCGRNMPKDVLRHGTPKFEWTQQQSEGLSKLYKWFKDKDGPQVFRLFGYAGTGKSTMAEEIMQMASMPVGCAYTGRAAMILRTKGVDAFTIHSLIYKPMRDEETGRMSYMLKDRSDIPFDFILLDECSFVDEELGRDIESLGIRMLVLGDPGQLKPINGAGYFVSPEITPDHMLTDIKRQALDNPIIRLSFMARKGQKIPVGQYGSSIVMDKRDFHSDVDELVRPYHGENMILVGTNKTRAAYNNRMRRLLGFDTEEQESYLPCVGETLMCLRNDNSKGLTNGSQWRVKEIGNVGIHECKYTVPDGQGGFRTRTSVWRRGEPGTEGEAVTVEAVSLVVESIDFPSADPVKVNVPTAFFYGSADKLHWRQKSGMGEFDYGYAATAHKAQGGQYRRTCIVDESYLFQDQRQQHLYTNLTRAIDDVLLAI